MRSARFLLVLSCLFLLVVPSYEAEAEVTPESALAKSDPVLGIWLPEEQDAAIELYACEDRICGRFYWLKDDSKESPSLDDRNPDPVQRNRHLCGLTFMGGFKADGKGGYTGGWLYSPRHGSMFSAALTLKDKDTLELRGYVFLPLLGGSQHWNRHKGQIKMAPCV
ncbi:MAG: DUF2147 domain-containing protein [Alphaproteobacteria bacterium]|nr:DUF2147 domain-containing protein [Alphaproteobacteria bacterium]